MIAALLLLLSQDVPAANAAPDENEIVVQATYGRTTMLFDKGADGKLRNCRIMVSSGSQRRDTNACQATPICFAGTADEVTDCVPLKMSDAGAVGGPLSVKNPNGLAVFAIPKLVQPKQPVSAIVAGPSSEAETSRETERQRVKLPPLPKPPTNGPVIRVTTAKDE